MFNKLSPLQEQIMSNSTNNVYKFGYNTGLLVKALLSTCHEYLYEKEKVAFSEIVWYVAKFPSRYKKWWIQLLEDDPLHVVIETILIVFVVYMVLIKRWKDDWRENNTKNGEVALSDQEKEELVREWKPAPLAPELTEEEESEEEHNKIVINKVDGSKVVIEGREGTVVNFASHDFLGFGSSQQALKDASKETLQKYGCGSCGPRGFYGTADVHLQLEEQFSSFCNTESAILYSDGATTVTSAIAAFAKRGDLLVVDEGVYEPIQTGVMLSRANVLFYKHNDMDDLRRVLVHVKETDAKLGRKPSEQRRFIVAEALYKHHGHITPLDKLVELKNEFSYRVILDESYSFGALGPTGRGIIELYNKDIMQDVEIVTISLENSIASIGGICVGSLEVVDHQRLSGAGYCFSASAPPFLASAAIQSLSFLKEQPSVVKTLHHNIQKIRDAISTSIPQLTITSDKTSPLMFLRIANPTMDEDEEALILKQIVKQCLKYGVIIVSATDYNETHFKLIPPPSIQIMITSAHSESDIQLLVDSLKKAVADVL